jgi:hypothetical protein
MYTARMRRRFTPLIFALGLVAAATGLGGCEPAPDLNAAAIAVLKNLGMDSGNIKDYEIFAGTAMPVAAGHVLMKIADTHPMNYDKAIKLLQESTGYYLESAQKEGELSPSYMSRVFYGLAKNKSNGLAEKELLALWKEGLKSYKETGNGLVASFDRMLGTKEVGQMTSSLMGSDKISPDTRIAVLKEFAGKTSLQFGYQDALLDTLTSAILYAPKDPKTHLAMHKLTQEAIDIGFTHLKGKHLADFVTYTLGSGGLSAKQRDALVVRAIDSSDAIYQSAIQYLPIARWVTYSGKERPYLGYQTSDRANGVEGGLQYGEERDVTHYGEAEARYFVKTYGVMPAKTVNFRGVMVDRINPPTDRGFSNILAEANARWPYADYSEAMYKARKQIEGIVKSDDRSEKTQDMLVEILTGLKKNILPAPEIQAPTMAKPLPPTTKRM